MSFQSVLYERKSTMARTVFWVSPKNGNWTVKHQGGTQFKDFITKQDAIAYARNWAHANMPSQVKVQLANGSIETEWTYGDDPVRYPG
jgi:hypothetical protein